MKEYGLSDEELIALGEDPNPQEQEPQEQWDGDFDFLIDFWL